MLRIAIARDQRQIKSIGALFDEFIGRHSLLARTLLILSPEPIRVRRRLSNALERSEPLVNLSRQARNPRSRSKCWGSGPISHWHRKTVSGPSLRVRRYHRRLVGARRSFSVSSSRHTKEDHLTTIRSLVADKMTNLLRKEKRRSILLKQLRKPGLGSR